MAGVTAIPGQPPPGLPMTSPGPAQPGTERAALGTRKDQSQPWPRERAVPAETAHAWRPRSAQLSCHRQPDAGTRQWSPQRAAGTAGARSRAGAVCRFTDVGGSVLTVLHGPGPLSRLCWARRHSSPAVPDDLHLGPPASPRALPAGHLSLPYQGPSQASVMGCDEVPAP